MKPDQKRVHFNHVTHTRTHTLHCPDSSLVGCEAPARPGEISCHTEAARVGGSELVRAEKGQRSHGLQQ